MQRLPEVPRWLITVGNRSVAIVGIQSIVNTCSSAFSTGLIGRCGDCNMQLVGKHY